MNLRKVFRALVYKVVSKNRESIYSEIERASCISFDVFDTLIKRNVADPKDVFAYMEQKFKLKEVFHLRGFTNLRISAEQKARTAIQGKEVTLSEIYRYMPLDEILKEQLMEMECQTECDLSISNIQLKPFYDICVEQGKPIFFISDMYLPRKTLDRILCKNGYVSGKLYVSSETGLTKHSGELFAYIREKEDLCFKDWVHIGDAISGDYYSPRKLGIRAHLVDPDPRSNQYYSKKLYKIDPEYRQLEHFIDTHIDRYTDPYKRIGYAVLGPLLYGFSVWLDKQIPRDETIVFLAREGALLKRAYEVVSERPSEYLMVSRHALNCVRIDHAAHVEEMIRTGIDSIKRYSKQSTWAKMYGLTDADIEKVFFQNNLDRDKIVSDEATKQRLLAAIWPTAKKNVDGQYGMFQSYLNQLGVSEHCAIVDVGWKGTMQALLSSVGLTSKGEVIRWDGYYFGIHKTGNEPSYSKYKKSAFLFDGGEQTHIRESIENSCQFFELLFLSTDGTTTHYELVDGNVRPVLEENENPDQVNRTINAMQEAGIEFVRDFSTFWLDRFDGIKAANAAANYEILARVPTLATLDLFRDFHTYDEGMNRLVEGEPFLSYLLHPKRMISDFAKSANKVWMLKNVFRIPLPYNAFTSFARRLIDKRKP